MRTRKIAFIFALVAFVPSLAHSANPPPSLYIQVKDTKLRAQPKYWAPVVAELNYGAKLTPLSAAPVDNSWIKVKLDSQEGFVHVSAITKRKIVFNSADTGSQKNVDTGSIALAGKGFNNQVESAYASSKGLDFKSVNEVENYSINGSELETFIKEGKLSLK